MNLLQHILTIDQLIERRRQQEDQDVLLAAGGTICEGLGFAGATGVPWSKTAPWATKQDFDHDGIVDALDDYFGPGAHPPSAGLSSVPWSQSSPWATRQDFDRDGICDALDNHFGPGAEDDG